MDALERAADILTEVSREYGIQAARFRQVSQGKLAASEGARSFEQSQSRIHTLMQEFKRTMSGAVR